MTRSQYIFLGSLFVTCIGLQLAILFVAPAEKAQAELLLERYYVTVQVTSSRVIVDNRLGIDSVAYWDDTARKFDVIIPGEYASLGREVSLYLPKRNHGRYLPGN